MMGVAAQDSNSSSNGLPLLNGISAQEARELFRYEPETGILRWRSSNRRARSGAAAGHVRSWDGYRQVKVSGTGYLAHRVIWLIVHGNWPDSEIDHINGDRTDNRITNLRVVDSQTNRRNQKIPSRNTSGVMGVSWLKRLDKWQAHIKTNSKQIYLGNFDSFLDAVAARLRAERKLGFHPNHGRRPAE